MKIAAAGSIEPESSTRGDYIRHGASRSLMSSIEEMAESARKLTEGETIVALDPSLIDASFMADRLEQQDDVNFAELKAAIRDHGQRSPILVRPHPTQNGRYMIVFGHRRVRAARELGVAVRAVIRDMADIEHLTAQGQENTARANLSFIEKALFAQKLTQMGHSRRVIHAALTIDESLLSRMLSVVEAIPMTVIEAIGAAKGVGRDRWEDLKRRMVHPASIAVVQAVIEQEDFGSRSSPQRFDAVLAAVKAARLPRRKGAAPAAGLWKPRSGMIEGHYKQSGKVFAMSLRATEAGDFGRYLVANLDHLYEAFQTARSRNPEGEIKQKKKAP
jgi:ParB family chromosome partitioning protein